MALLENISLALAGLKSNKMRAILTMLGIIIGIGSVIAIVTVGNSLTNSVTSSMQDMGANNIQVGLQLKNPDSNRYYITESDLIDDEKIDLMMQMYGDQIEAVSLDTSVDSGQVRDGHKYANTSMTGVNEGYAAANNLELVEGRFINEKDTQGEKNVAVVSDKLVKNMFGENASGLGKEIKYKTSTEVRTYTIVGVYKYTQNAMMAMMGYNTAADKDISTVTYIPVTTAKKIIGDYDGYTYIMVMAKGTQSAQLTQDLQEFFNKLYEKNAQFSILVLSMESMISQMTTMLGTMSIAIAIIAGISLLVGGIGVMNIMLVSITERTREIGTRKALGAKNSSIRIQFIVESMIICLIGGVIGIILGVGLGYAGASLLGFPASPSVEIIIIAVGFSMLIGVFFGYYPANKAAKMDPIEALRYE